MQPPSVGADALLWPAGHVAAAQVIPPELLWPGNGSKSTVLAAQVRCQATYTIHPSPLINFGIFENFSPSVTTLKIRESMRV